MGKTVKILKKLSVTELAGEKVMVDFDTGKYFLIKGVGNTIWDMLEDGISVDAIVEKLLEDFDVEREECVEATENFLKQLSDNEFIEFV